MQLDRRRFLGGWLEVGGRRGLDCGCSDGYRFGLELGFDCGEWFRFCFGNGFWFGG
jgi:hypothetical protein